MWLTNSSRHHLEIANKTFAEAMPPGALVLDAGAGNAPYKHLLGHVRYESADFEMVDKPYAKSTYVCNLCEHIPVEDGRFDYVVFNQVLEHLPEPLSALRELHRVLKPGGKILCSAPLFYEEHEQPYDFYRYTRFGFRYLFEQAGFTIDSISELEGFFGTAGYMCESMYRYLPLRPVAASWQVLALWPVAVAMKCLSFVVAGVFYRIDMHTKWCGTGFAKNYVVLARKV